MKLTNEFEVPLPPAEAWDLLLDIERIAPCLPGATITETVDEKTYKGKVAVRLGPVALEFQGRARFEEIDDKAHTAHVKAQGADGKGRGGANADVAFRLEPTAAGSKVLIETDLNLSGSIAQYGRGGSIIEATSEQLIGEFADNLRRQLSEKGDEGAAARDSAEEAQAPKPISGLTLLFRALWARLRRIFAGRG